MRAWLADVWDDTCGIYAKLIGLLLLLILWPVTKAIIVLAQLFDKGVHGCVAVHDWIMRTFVDPYV